MSMTEFDLLGSNTNKLQLCICIGISLGVLF